VSSTQSSGVTSERKSKDSFFDGICFILIVVVSFVVTGYARVICACLNWHLYLHACSSCVRVNDET